MNLVRGVGIPNDEFSILRGRNEVTTVGGPVHGVNLGQMPLERPARLHTDTRQSLGLVLCDLTDCIMTMKHESVNQSDNESEEKANNDWWCQRDATSS